MNILFLSLVPINDLSERIIYTDLLRQFVQRGHFVRIVSPMAAEKTEDVKKSGYAILKVSTVQIQKVNMIQKGIASLQIGPRIKGALARCCGDEHYDLILVATPPITIAGTVEWVKRRDGASVYLLLKDIWPQAIADLGVISAKGLIYKYYRFREKRLYALADRIGCMSPANVEYLLRHNPEIPPEKVELCPNSIEPAEQTAAPAYRVGVRERYGIPQDRLAFLYGGNLGRPQGIPFIIECLRACREKSDCYFIICGTGTEYPLLKKFVDREQPENVLLIHGLPKEEYEELTAACDVGLLFLDHRFTIPNFPSRLLSYMDKGLPVLACTDCHTDIGEILEAGGFGWKCLSDQTKGFCDAVDLACRADRAAMGQRAREYLRAHYTAEQGYRIITKE